MSFAGWLPFLVYFAGARNWCSFRHRKIHLGRTRTHMLHKSTAFEPRSRHSVSDAGPRRSFQRQASLSAQSAGGLRFYS